MGTPEFARESLQYLYDDKYDIAAVFTAIDKPRNRGMKPSPTPVKELAVKNNTPVYHPIDLTADKIKSLGCDLIVVVAFGEMLREDILLTPPLGCINIHGSMLPKYRGAAPIQHAILNGDTITGVTAQYMSKKMDEGDIIHIETTPIGDDETSEDLFSRLSRIGGELLIRTVFDIENGAAPRISQNHADATYAPKLTKDMAPIDFNASANEIKNKIRAFVPWPVATAPIGGRMVKVYSADIGEKAAGELPGKVIGGTDRGIEIACKDGTVIITRLQAPGGKILSAADYMRGNPLV